MKKIDLSSLLKFLVWSGGQTEGLVSNVLDNASKSSEGNTFERIISASGFKGVVEGIGFLSKFFASSQSKEKTDFLSMIGIKNITYEILKDDTIKTFRNNAEQLAEFLTVFISKVGNESYSSVNKQQLKTIFTSLADILSNIKKTTSITEKMSSEEIIEQIAQTISENEKTFAAPITNIIVQGIELFNSQPAFIATLIQSSDIYSNGDDFSRILPQLLTGIPKESKDIKEYFSSYREIQDPSKRKLLDTPTEYRLHNLDFSHLTLENVVLNNKIIQNADFSCSVLHKVNFMETIFSGVDFSGCEIKESTSFKDATFDKKSFTTLATSLRKAEAQGIKIDLTGTKFIGDFSEVDFSLLDLTGSDFSKATGLENAKNFDHTILTYAELPDLYPSISTYALAEYNQLDLFAETESEIIKTTSEIVDIALDKELFDYASRDHLSRQLINLFHSDPDYYNSILQLKSHKDLLIRELSENAALKSEIAFRNELRANYNSIASLVKDPTVENIKELAKRVTEHLIDNAVSDKINRNKLDALMTFVRSNNLQIKDCPLLLHRTVTRLLKDDLRHRFVGGFDGDKNLELIKASMISAIDQNVDGLLENFYFGTPAQTRLFTTYIFNQFKTKYQNKLIEIEQENIQAQARLGFRGHFQSAAKKEISFDDCLSLLSDTFNTIDKNHIPSTNYTQTTAQTELLSIKPYEKGTFSFNDSDLQSLVRNTLKKPGESVSVDSRFHFTHHHNPLAKSTQTQFQEREMALKKVLISDHSDTAKQNPTRENIFFASQSFADYVIALGNNKGISNVTRHAIERKENWFGKIIYSMVKESPALASLNSNFHNAIKALSFTDLTKITFFIFKHYKESKKFFAELPIFLGAIDSEKKAPKTVVKTLGDFIDKIAEVSDLEKKDLHSKKHTSKYRIANGLAFLINLKPDHANHLMNILHTIQPSLKSEKIKILSAVTGNKEANTSLFNIMAKKKREIAGDIVPVMSAIGEMSKKGIAKRK